jgi:hypothetical protein
VQQGAPGDAVGAKAVQNRLAEAAGGRELRVDVQRVAVARQPVDQRLFRPRLVDDLVVGLPVRPLPPWVGATGTAEAARAADEDPAAAGNQDLAGGLIGRHVFGGDQRA